MGTFRISEHDCHTQRAQPDAPWLGGGWHLRRCRELTHYGVDPIRTNHHVCAHLALAAVEAERRAVMLPLVLPCILLCDGVEPAAPPDGSGLEPRTEQRAQRLARQVQVTST
jgi:hypothetical protein